MSMPPSPPGGGNSGDEFYLQARRLQGASVFRNSGFSSRQSLRRLVASLVLKFGGEYFKAVGSLATALPPRPCPHPALASEPPTPRLRSALQCGVAIRTLREELPRIFERDLSYDIYRDDITFIDNISAFPGGLSAINATHGKVRQPFCPTRSQYRPEHSPPPIRKPARARTPRSRFRCSRPPAPALQNKLHRLRPCRMRTAA